MTTDEPAPDRRVVGGVDTHKNLHVAAVVDERDRLIASRSFATTRQGYRQMLAWMRSFGQLDRVGVEATGTYGAGLLRHLQAAGVEVLEVTAPDKPDRRRRGKNDDLDAEAAAHAAFAGKRAVTPKTRDGMIEALRVLKACRKTAVTARRVALQMIQNTIVCAPDDLRDTLRRMTRMQLVRTLAAWRPDLTDYRNSLSAYRIALKSLARRYLQLHDEIADLDDMIAAIVDELAPELVARNSIGHGSAAQLLLTAGDNPKRLRSEASFAALVASARSPPPPAKRPAIASTAAAIERPTAPCTSSPSAGSAPTSEPKPMSPGASPRATPSSRPFAASSGISRARSSPCSGPDDARSTRRNSPLDT